jgi:uncharacterized membrane protein (UPF0127 family)
VEKIEILGIKAKVARTFRERARGLIAMPKPPPGEGLLILRCNAIHTFFMSYAIDAVFLDSQDRVVKCVKNIKPWRPFIWGGWRAVKVLERASAF